MAIDINGTIIRKIDIDGLSMNKIYIDNDLFFSSEKLLPNASGFVGLGWSPSGPKYAGKTLSTSWDCRGHSSLRFNAFTETRMNAGDPYGLESNTNIILIFGSKLLTVMTAYGKLYSLDSKYYGQKDVVVDLSPYTENELSNVKIYLEISNMKAGDPSSGGMSHTASVSITKAFLE